MANRGVVPKAVLSSENEAKGHNILFVFVLAEVFASVICGGNVQ